jgi:hypothetical protein
MTVGAGDADPAGFERLTQRLQRGAIELRNYVGVSPAFFGQPRESRGARTRVVFIKK